jgi:peptidyl-prolyl cis-trans isomerase A (cyclophilin A)
MLLNILNKLEPFRLPIAAILVFVMVSCGGGSSTPLATPSVQTSRLVYGSPIAFYVGITQLNQGITLNATLCSSLQQVVSPSPVYLAYSCTPNGTGTMVFTATDSSGNVLLSKNFTIPDPQVTLVTSKGTIVLDLNPNAAPKTVNNFLQYVSSGFYSNIIFHRVIPGFVIQAGGFTSGLNAVNALFPAINLETPNGLSNLTGTLAMARTSDPNSATSQFYINVADNTNLDYVDSNNPGYAVFGKVVTGLDVVNAIAAVSTQTVGAYSDVPVSDVTITSATRTQ